MFLKARKISMARRRKREPRNRTIFVPVEFTCVIPVNLPDNQPMKRLNKVAAHIALLKAKMLLGSLEGGVWRAKGKKFTT